MTTLTPPAPGHDHFFLGSHQQRNERRVWLVIALTAVMMVAEIVAGTVYGSMALQLAAYANAEFYLDADDTEQPMPPIDRYGVLHVTEYGTTLHHLPADQNEAAWKDFLHVQFVGRRAKEIDTYLIEETTNG